MKKVVPFVVGICIGMIQGYYNLWKLERDYKQMEVEWKKDFSNYNIYNKK